MAKSRYTKLVYAMSYGSRIYSHTHPRIAGTHVVVWPEQMPGVRDWTAYETLDEAESDTAKEFYRSRGNARIGV